MLERFGLTAQEQLTCGFHVHTYIESKDEGVAVLDRIRDKLAVLTALSANSPFWKGMPTGFESYRTQAWNRWPTSGPSAIFGTYSQYRRVVTRLLDSGVMLDEGMIYFDARLSRNHPTVEVRVADVCLRAEDAALIAVLVRAMVESASREWRDGVEPAPVPTVLLRMAAWQASSSGLGGELLDFGTFRPAPAVDVVRSLVDYLAPVLAEQGELALARQGVEDIIARGTGSAEQRRVRDAAMEKTGPDDGGLGAVVAHAVGVTMRGTSGLPEADEAPECCGCASPESAPRTCRALAGNTLFCAVFWGRYLPLRAGSSLNAGGVRPYCPRREPWVPRNASAGRPPRFPPGRKQTAECPWCRPGWQRRRARCRPP